MKKQTAYAAVFLTGLVLMTGSTSAQTNLSSEPGAGPSSGGLGKGLSNMVRGILGEQESSGPRYSVPAEPSLMMQMDAAADMGSFGEDMAPQTMMTSMKAANAAETIVPMTNEELSEYVHRLILEDSNIQSIDTADTHVRITYAVPSKVFRMVNVVLRVTVGAQVSGRTEVTYPWYAFATAGAASDLKKDVALKVSPLIPSQPFTPDEQRLLIDAIHGTLAARLGTSTGGDH